MSRRRRAGYSILRARALPACGCNEHASITIEFPEGPRVYDRIAASGDSCNPLTCEPEAAYASYRSTRSSTESLEKTNNARGTKTLFFH